jgi:predicted pyridoxine 5'-phosphate oxidase superfamily flavin-nucleotide-binding protein
MNHDLAWLRDKWENRQGVPILATVDAKGVPNAIYFSIGGFFEDRTFFIADNYFYKTRSNILSGSLASVLFLTPDRQSFQMKGKIHLEHEGVVYDAMRFINPPNHPGRAAAVLCLDSVYSGAKCLWKAEA